LNKNNKSILSCVTIPHKATTWSVDITPLRHIQGSTTQKNDRHV